MTEAVAQDPSSKTDTTASDHPRHQSQQQDGPIGDKVEFRHHTANPGPVVHENIKNIPEEGTKEERQKKTEEMNK